MISNAAVKSGFSGGLVVDYPNSALAKKYYLVLTTEYQGKLEIKQIVGKDGVEDDDSRAEEDEVDTKRDKDIKKKIAAQ
jgi:18S rRNA (guanine1575-N7)-methyltransferase